MVSKKRKIELYEAKKHMKDVEEQWNRVFETMNLINKNKCVMCGKLHKTPEELSYHYRYECDGGW